jgi:CRISPR-associated protein Csm1
MDERVLNAALAGLLHDVGKIRQRAEVEPWRPAPDLKDSGQPVHATWSIYIANTVVPKRYQAAALAGGYHHIPNKSPAEHQALSELIELADKLSAGERADLTQTYRGSSPPRQLVTIFDRINNRGETDGWHYLPLLPLSLHEKGKALFPSESRSEEGQSNAYEFLRHEVEEAIKQDIADPETYLENTLLALERLIWCVPSAYYHSVPDVSLYDHSRTTAAIAVCLTAFNEGEVRMQLETMRRAFHGNTQAGDEAILRKPIALLVGGDISGIQNFIYTITGKGAASALRGRSLYLQLLTEAVARYVLRRLDLPITNLLFAGGGHFYLLARYSDGKTLDEIRREVSRILLTHHRGDLYLALEWGELAAKDFKGKPLSQKWSELSATLRQAKLRRFSELAGDELYRAVFEPRHDRGNEEDECQVCGWEHPDTKPKQPPAGEARKCPQCESYEDLGRDLRKAKYLRLSALDKCEEVKNDRPPGKADTALACFGLRARLYDTLDELQNDAAALASARRSVIYALRDDALDALKPEARTAVGRRFFVNVTPVIDDLRELFDLQREGVDGLPEEKSVREGGAVKPLTALEHHSQGIERLGVLRMDVDNMGRIIGEGLGDQATFSRIATLSFMVNLFFEGWAAELARKHNRQEGEQYDPEKGKYDRVYSIYSGGDDLFFVGAWDRIAELALEVQNDLKRFVAEHPGIHASAGIVLVGGKYPLYQAAEDAGEALEAAKDRPGKNAINFLGQTLDWEKFARAHDRKGTFVKWVEDKGVPRGLLQRLTRLYLRYLRKDKEMKDRGEGKNQAGEEQTYWGPWHWHTAYQLARLKVKEEAKTELDELRNQLSSDNFRAIKWIGLAARWADLLTR